MQWTVVVPGALLPAAIAAELPAEAVPPALAALLRRAAVQPLQVIALPFDGAAHLGWLWQAFGGTGIPISAPYAWRALGGDAAGATASVWHADPVHFALARDHMLVTPLAELPADEADALRAEAEPILAAAGARLRVAGGHWFIAFDAAWSLQATPLDAALGESAQERLPQGADAARWRRLLTELQIAWHHGAANARRSERGEPAVNGLWLHGGGDAPALPAARFARVASETTVTRGWAHAAGVAAVTDGADPIGSHDGADSTGDALLEWRALFAPFKAEDWGGWLAQWQRLAQALPALVDSAATAGAEVELVLCGRAQVRRVSIARADRWKLWRNQALAPLLAEPAEAA